MPKPQIYKSEFCEKLIEHCAQGLTFNTFAGVVGVSNKTLHEWVRVRPEFARAKEVAEMKGMLVFEKMGNGLITGKLKGSAVAFIHQICNRYPNYYKHRIDIVQQKEEENKDAKIPESDLNKEIEELIRIVNTSKS